MKCVYFGWGAFTVVLLFGCGGASSQAPENSQIAQIGQVSLSYKGKLKPQVSSASGAVSVAGVSGAAFSTIDFYPARNTVNSIIAYTFENEIYAIQNGTTSLVTHLPLQNQTPSVGPNGKIALSGVGANSRLQIYTVNPDGTALTQLTSIGGVFPRWSPDGKHIAFEGDNGASLNLYVMNPDGTGLTDLTPSASLVEEPVTWSADSQSILFGETLSGTNQFFSIPATGGTATHLSLLGFTSTNVTNPSYSPDGNTLAFNANAETVIYDLTLQQFASITPSGSSDFSPSFSPDSSSLVMHRIVNSTGNGGITRVLANGDQPTVLFPDTGSNQAFEPSWGPYQSFQRFIGSGGSLGSASSGFLFAQNGDSFSSLISFTATTPSTATLLPAVQTGGEGAPLVFSLHADSISRLIYVNGYMSTSMSVSPTNATDVMISFSSVTGQVTLVAPLSAPAKKIADRGTSIIYSGSFLAIYDGTGKNLAPSGASQIELNPKTGAILSFR